MDLPALPHLWDIPRGQWLRSVLEQSSPGALQSLWEAGAKHWEQHPWAGGIPWKRKGNVSMAFSGARISGFQPLPEQALAPATQGSLCTPQLLAAGSELCWRALNWGVQLPNAGEPVASAGLGDPAEPPGSPLGIPRHQTRLVWAAVPSWVSLGKAFPPPWGCSPCPALSPALP